MAKTFDNISEASATNYLFLFTQRTLALQNEPPTPPPLNALGLPCHAVCLLWARLYPQKAAVHTHLSTYLFFLAACGVAAAEKAVQSSYAKVEKQKKRAGDHQAAASEEEFLEKIAPLARKITEYINGHQDDAAREDRWRTTMQRETMKRFRELRDTQAEAIAEVRQAIDKQREATAELRQLIVAGFANAVSTNQVEQGGAETENFEC